MYDATFVKEVDGWSEYNIIGEDGKILRGVFVSPEGYVGIGLASKQAALDLDWDSFRVSPQEYINAISKIHRGKIGTPIPGEESGLFSFGKIPVILCELNLSIPQLPGGRVFIARSDRRTINIYVARDGKAYLNLEDIPLGKVAKEKYNKAVKVYQASTTQKDCRSVPEHVGDGEIHPIRTSITLAELAPETAQITKEFQGSLGRAARTLKSIGEAGTEAGINKAAGKLNKALEKSNRIASIFGWEGGGAAAVAPAPAPAPAPSPLSAQVNGMMGDLRAVKQMRVAEEIREANGLANMRGRLAALQTGRPVVKAPRGGSRKVKGKGKTRKHKNKRKTVRK
jgi:hypothetical protein